MDSEALGPIMITTNGRVGFPLNGFPLELYDLVRAGGVVAFEKRQRDGFGYAVGIIQPSGKDDRLGGKREVEPAGGDTADHVWGTLMAVTGPWALEGTGRLRQPG